MGRGKVRFAIEAEWAKETQICVLFKKTCKPCDNSSYHLTFSLLIDILTSLWVVGLQPSLFTLNTIYINVVLLFY